MFGQILEGTAPNGCGVREHGASEIRSHIAELRQGAPSHHVAYNAVAIRNWRYRSQMPSRPSLDGPVALSQFALLGPPCGLGSLRIANKLLRSRPTKCADAAPTDLKKAFVEKRSGDRQAVEAGHPLRRLDPPKVELR